jgi:hypothetical protein
MLAGVGEESQIPLFDTLFDKDSPPNPAIPNPDINDGTRQDVEQPNNFDQCDMIPVEPRQSARGLQPSKAGIQSLEYQQHEAMSKVDGLDWATNQKQPKALSAADWSFTQANRDNFIACLIDTKASHTIPRSY